MVSTLCHEGGAAHSGAGVYQSIQDGSATDEDRKRLKNLREQYIALSKEVEDVMGRLLIGKHLHHS